MSTAKSKGTSKIPGYDPLFPSSPVDLDDPEGLGRIAEVALLEARSSHGGICHEIPLKNKYFSANVLVWIDEFSYFKRPLNASALKNIPINTNGKGSKIPSLHQDVSDEELSKPLLGDDNDSFDGSAGLNSGKDSSLQNNSESKLASTQHAATKEDSFDFDKHEKQNQIDQADIPFLEDIKSWVDAYCSDDEDVKMVRDGLLAIIYTFDSTHPYPESLKDSAGSHELAATEAAGNDIGTAFDAIADTQTNNDEPPSLAELDAIAVENKQSLEQRHLNSIEAQIKQLLRLVEKLEDEEWDGLFLAACKDVRSLDSLTNPNEIAIINEYKTLTQPDLDRISSISQKPSLGSRFTITPPPQRNIVSEEKLQLKKNALETARRVTQYVSDHVLGDTPYEVINLNEGTDPKTFQENKTKSGNKVNPKGGDLAGMDYVEMLLSSLFAFSAVEKEQGHDTSSESLGDLESGELRAVTNVKDVGKSNTKQDGSLSKSFVDGRVLLSDNDKDSNTLNSLPNQHPTENYDPLNDESSELSKEIDRIYTETVAKTGLSMPLLDSPQPKNTTLRGTRDGEAQSGSERGILDTESLVEKLRDFKLNVGEMEPEEAQRYLNDISADLSKFI